MIRIDNFQLIHVKSNVFGLTWSMCNGFRDESDVFSISAISSLSAVTISIKSDVPAIASSDNLEM